MFLNYCVIIPTLGRPELLRRAVRSVYAQTIPPSKVHVIVDEVKGLGDYRFLEGYGESMEVSFTGGNCGAAKARNLGLARAAHNFVFFLDDDDEWLPMKCARQMELLNERTEYVGVTCGREIVFSDGKRSRIIPNSTILSRYVNCINYTGSFSFFGFARQRIPREILLDERLPALQDHEFYMRIARIGGIGVVDEVLGIYHDHDGERISTQFSSKAKALKYIALKHEETLTWSDKYYYISREKYFQMLAAKDPIEKMRLRFLWALYRMMAAKVISLPKCFMSASYARR